MASEETRMSAPISMRAGKIRFRRHMRVVAQISDDLWALLKLLPAPDKDELEEGLSPLGGLSRDLHFLGALHAIHYLISEAVLIAEEEKRYAKSRAGSTFIVDHRVMKQLENEARFRRHPPPPPVAEDETEEDAE